MTSPRPPVRGDPQLPVGLDAFASVASTAAPIPTAARPTRSSSSIYGYGSPVGSVADGETDSTGSGEDEVEDSSRRQVHNLCERNRRHHIREGFTSLQRRLPSGAGTKMSKMEILRAAIGHLESLRSFVGDLETELALLRKLRGQQQTHPKTPPSSPVEPT